MTNKEALEFAKKECTSYKRKIEDGYVFYQKVVDYYEVVIDALEKQDQCCKNCDHRKNRDFDRYLCNKRWMWVYDDMHCSDWSEKE